MPLLPRPSGRNTEHAKGSVMRTISSVALAAAVVAGAALACFASTANAMTYVLDGNFNGTIVDVDITVSGSDVTGISGTVSGYGSVSTYTGPGSTGSPSFITSGLYTGSGVFTVQNPPGSGGANLTVDNLWFSSDPHLDSNGIAFLLTDGLSANLWGNSPGSYGLFIGAYNVNTNNTRPVSVDATPLPSTWTMLIVGFVGLGFFAYRGSRRGSAAIVSV
jgi:hypothetical protein